MTSTIQMRRIKNYMEANFKKLLPVDMLPSDKQEQIFLSRCTAAMAIMSQYPISNEDAANCVVDDGWDGGIDAIYFDPQESELVLAQSKWHSSGKGAIDTASVLKFIEGIKALLDADFSKFNKKIQSKEKDVTSFLDDPSVRIIAMIAYNTPGDISADVKNLLEKYIDDVNRPGEIIEYRVIKGTDLLTVASSKVGGPINDDIALQEWAVISDREDSRKAFIGIMSAADLAALYDKHRSRLFDKNIRFSKGKTDINNGMCEVLIHEPSNFLFFNNGITLVASKVQKKAIGGSSQRLGIFACENISVVNGAQTVAMCHRSKAESGRDLRQACVLVKLIEVDDANFANRITIAANTQNRVEKSDFASLDDYQASLQKDLEVLGVNYHYKTGDDESKGASDFNITTATLSLVAYTGDINLISLAKREIGQLLDINGKHYRRIFNPSHNAFLIKNIVELYKIIMVETHKLVENKRDEGYFYHGNAFMAYLVLERIDKKNIGSECYDIVNASDFARKATPVLFRGMRDIFENVYGNSYLAHLFRNAAKLDSQIKEIKKIRIE